MRIDLLAALALLPCLASACAHSHGFAALARVEHRVRLETDSTSGRPVMRTVDEQESLPMHKPPGTSLEFSAAPVPDGFRLSIHYPDHTQRTLDLSDATIRDRGSYREANLSSGPLPEGAIYYVVEYDHSVAGSPLMTSIPVCESSAVGLFRLVVEYPAAWQVRFDHKNGDRTPELPPVVEGNKVRRTWEIRDLHAEETHGTTLHQDRCPAIAVTVDGTGEVR